MYGGYSGGAVADSGYGGYSAPSIHSGYGGYDSGMTNGSPAVGMPAMPAGAGPPLPPKPPKPPSDPQAMVMYDYDPAGQEGMVAVSAGQVRQNSSCRCIFIFV